MSTTQNAASRWPNVKRWLWRSAYAVAGLLLCYAIFLLVGFVPINNNYREPAEDRVTLYIRTNEIHTDLVMPVFDQESGIDWRTLFPAEHFRRDVRGFQYVAAGWGDRGFFVETPTWKDLKIATVVKALFVPSEAVLHVEYVPVSADHENLHAFTVSRAQYQELARFVESTVAATEARGAATTATEVTYGQDDRFYQATGSYHLFNTCNQWTGRGLARAGVRTGIWTPLKPHVLCWLPKKSE